MSDHITLNISTNAHERVTKQWLQDTLRQFNSGDLSLNQTRDAILGYFAQSDCPRASWCAPIVDDAPPRS
jgi:hypothetical protein